MEKKEIDKEEEFDIQEELVSPELLSDSLDFEEQDLDKLPI